MPRTIIIADPTSATTIGLVLNVARLGAGAAGVEIRLDVPGDPDGTFVTTLDALSASERTALSTFFDGVVAIFKAARPYV